MDAGWLQHRRGGGASAAERREWNALLQHRTQRAVVADQRRRVGGRGRSGDVLHLRDKGACALHRRLEPRRDPLAGQRRRADHPARRGGPDRHLVGRRAPSGGQLHGLRRRSCCLRRRERRIRHLAQRGPRRRSDRRRGRGHPAICVPHRLLLERAGRRRVRSRPMGRNRSLSSRRPGRRRPAGASHQLRPLLGRRVPGSRRARRHNGIDRVLSAVSRAAPQRLVRTRRVLLDADARRSERAEYRRICRIAGVYCRTRLLRHSFRRGDLDEYAGGDDSLHDGQQQAIADSRHGVQRRDSDRHDDTATCDRVPRQFLSVKSRHTLLHLPRGRAAPDRRWLSGQRGLGLRHGP